jgi:protein-S-isoprenylcysteine O-methyltransferase Ste14
VTLAVALAMWAAARQWPRFHVAIPGSLPVAAALAVLGAVVALAGIAAFRAAGTTVNPLRPGGASALVRRGVYRISRNPMYLGLVAGLLGWGLYLSHALALACVPVLAWWLDRFQVAPEEQAMRAKFGQAFDDYARSVRRWL